jgi:hypothetical protein
MLERFMAYLRDMFDKFKAAVLLPSGLNRQELADLNTAVDELILKMRGADGRRIFTQKDGEIAFAETGRLLKKSRYSVLPLGREIFADNKYSFGKSNADDEYSEEYLAQSMAEIYNKDNSEAVRFFNENLSDSDRYDIENGVRKGIDNLNLSALKEPWELDDAREMIIPIRVLNTMYNQTSLRTPKERDKIAIKIEYARRCFENDRRILGQTRYQSSAVRGQGRNGSTDVRGIAGRHNNGESVGAGGRDFIGLARFIGNERGKSYKNFLKLFEEWKKEKHSLADDAKRSASSASSVKYSASSDQRQVFAWSLQRLAEKLHMDGLLKKGGWLKADNVTAAERKIERGIINPLKAVFYSPAHMARIYPALKYFINNGMRATAKQEKIRYEFNNGMNAVYEELGYRKSPFKKNMPGYEERRKKLADVLWQGDLDGREYTLKELREDFGLDEHTAKAYKMVRELVAKSWELVNDTKQQAAIYSKNMSAAEYEKLKENKFVKILSVAENGSGRKTVSWRQPRIFEHEQILTKQELEDLEKDANTQIIKSKPLKTLTHALPQEKGIIHGDEYFAVQFRSQAQPLGKLTGYIPHMFHELFIMQKVTDKAGNASYQILKSAKTMRQAVRIANELAENNKDAEIFISPKKFQFPNEREQAAVMGDTDYFNKAYNNSNIKHFKI